MNIIPLECSRNPVYHTSVQQKLQSQKSAKIYRYGTPKLRDLLREKCRIRVREARQNSFQNSRKLQNIPVEEILREELAELEKDISLQEEIYKELVDELNEWFVEQLEEQIEQEGTYLMDVAENNALLCPVCQKDFLKTSAETSEFRQLYTCKCKACFGFVGDEQRLRSALDMKINLHEQKCVAALIFFVEPQTGDRTKNVLNAICEKCDYICSF